MSPCSALEVMLPSRSRMPSTLTSPPRPCILYAYSASAALTFNTFTLSEAFSLLRNFSFRENSTIVAVVAGMIALDLVTLVIFGVYRAHRAHGRRLRRAKLFDEEVAHRQIRHFARNAQRFQEASRADDPRRFNSARCLLRYKLSICKATQRRELSSKYATANQCRGGAGSQSTAASVETDASAPAPESMTEGDARGRVADLDSLPGGDDELAWRHPQSLPSPPSPQSPDESTASSTEQCSSASAGEGGMGILTSDAGLSPRFISSRIRMVDTGFVSSRIRLVRTGFVNTRIHAVVHPKAAAAPANALQSSRSRTSMDSTNKPQATTEAEGYTPSRTTSMDTDDEPQATTEASGSMPTTQCVGRSPPVLLQVGGTEPGAMMRSRSQLRVKISTSVSEAANKSSTQSHARRSSSDSSSGLGAPSGGAKRRRETMHSMAALQDRRRELLESSKAAGLKATGPRATGPITELPLRDAAIRFLRAAGRFNRRFVETMRSEHTVVHLLRPPDDEDEKLRIHQMVQLFWNALASELFICCLFYNEDDDEGDQREASRGGRRSGGTSSGIGSSVHPCMIRAALHPCIHPSIHPCIHASMHACSIKSISCPVQTDA